MTSDVPEFEIPECWLWIPISYHGPFQMDCEPEKYEIILASILVHHKMAKRLLKLDLTMLLTLAAPIRTMTKLTTASTSQ